MTLKWIYAAVVVAAVAVLSLALRGGSPQGVAPTPNAAATGPRIVGGGRVDPALPAPRTLPAEPEAGRASAPVGEGLVDADTEAEPAAGLGAAPERTTAPAEPTVRSREPHLSGAIGSPSRGGRVQSATADAPSAMRIRFRSGVPEPVAPAAQAPVTQAPAPVADANLPAGPVGPEPPDLSNTPADQRAAILDLWQKQNEQNIRTAQDLTP